MTYDTCMLLHYVPLVPDDSTEKAPSDLGRRGICLLREWEATMVDTHFQLKLNESVETEDIVQKSLLR